MELRRVGEPPRINTALEHFDLGEKLGMMDFTAGAKLSGARFTVLRGKLARLERALGQFMLDLHVNEHGFTEVMPPLLVRDEAAFGTGQLPKFSEDLFRTNTGHWLIPTAEVPLTNLVADRILDLEDLPLRMTALTPCFRSEAGAAGKDTRGMIRQHQFWKVEMVSVTGPDQSQAEHERMTEMRRDSAEAAGLAVPHHRALHRRHGFLGPQDLRHRGLAAGSEHVPRDFQRLQLRRLPGAPHEGACRPRGEKNTQFVHTLNGSGVAVGRCLIAVMENFQQPDGSIIVPEALRPYMGGLDRISADA